ncbi:MAG: redox-regulated ATPase YchF [Bacilli bacterium]|nr:redox-regulated ATPase YchF [Bacilli bacterium]
MGLKAGIVGLPNVGKSTLFNAITKKNVLAANYPFATIEPNVGIVELPDERMNYLKDLYLPKSFVPTAFEFIDIAGLVAGASKGEGLGNKFLSHIREVDAICEVVRCFENSNITHVSGAVDPTRDVDIINVELMLADLEVVYNRINKIGKKASLSADKEIKAESLLLEKLKDALENDVAIRDIVLDEEELKKVKSYNLLTVKPIVYVANVTEEDLIAGTNEYVEQLKQYVNEDVIMMCAKIESELGELNEEEKMLFLNDLGIKESGLEQLIKVTYHKLGLETFFTAGSDEVRAWTFVKGTKAPKCAGIIHSDIERGFIKAEVMSFAVLKEHGNEKKVQEAGKLRIEGKEYVMQDGDIVYFRFNV